MKSDCRSTVCFTFGRSDDSGASQMGYYFARDFRRRGWKVTAICPAHSANGDASLIERLMEAGVEVELVPAFGSRLDVPTGARFKAHLVRTGANLVVSMHQEDMKFAAFASLVTSVPWVVSGQNVWTFSGNIVRRWVAAAVLRDLLRRQCIGVVATSRTVEGEFRKVLGYRGPIAVQANGVDTSVFQGSRSRREAIRRELGVGPDSRVIVTVGRVTEQKNQVGLVEAFARAFPGGASGSERFHLWMVGSPGAGVADEEYLRKVESKVNELGLNSRVRVTGWRIDVPDILPAADLYVQPSLWEGSPLAVLEAMASGLPVIVANNGGVLPDFRHGIHGWVVSVGDVAALEAAFRDASALSGPEMAARAKAARELATTRYDASQVASRFFEVVTQWLVHRKPSRSAVG